jgi:CDP-glycerol glycerophosphotransferase (TagB/SpsB family)
MDFNNKKVFIAPYSPMTKNLREFLQKQGVIVLGFIDKNVTGKDIFHLENIKNVECDAYLILSPNHFHPIYIEFKKVVPSDKIFQVIQQDTQYKFYNKKTIFFHQLKSTFSSLHVRIKKLFLRSFSKLLDMLKFKRTLNVFIGEGHIDANVKHLYLYYYKQGLKSIILTDNKEQLAILKEYNLPSCRLHSWISHFYIAIAKNIFLDHIVYNYLEYLSPNQKTVQLWHGVGLKKINDMSNIKYDYFISTSDWTNETNFKNVFKAKEFLALGYPRLDIFFKEEDTLDLIFCDMQIYNLVKNSNHKKILYMPTYRENEKYNTPPLDFELLNEQMKEMDAYFIVKFHPFVKLKIAKQLSNIIFYETQGDIYPILKYVDILVSDYSSVIYDFLLLDRPIISFNYDYDDYTSHRNGFLFDYFEYSPCKFVTTQSKLVIAIKKEDIIEEKRKKITKLFFDTNIQNNSTRISKWIASLKIIRNG